MSLWARVVEAELDSMAQNFEGGPDRRSLQHQLRRVPSVQTRQLFRLPTFQPQCGDGGCAVWLHDGRPVWLLAPHRRLRRRPSRICAGADGRCRADESAGRDDPDEEVLFLTDGTTHRLSGSRAGRRSRATRSSPIWGTGPVGLFAIQSAKVLKPAERIVMIETVPERIAMARKAGATDIIDFAKEDVAERIKETSERKGRCRDRLRQHGKRARVADRAVSSAP